MLAGDARRGAETEIPGIISGILPGQADWRRGSRWNHQAGGGKVSGDSERYEVVVKSCQHRGFFWDLLKNPAQAGWEDPFGQCREPDSFRNFRRRREGATEGLGRG